MGLFSGLNRRDERESIETGVPVVESGVGDVIERDTDAHPVSGGAGHVEAGGDLVGPAEIDVSIAVIGPYRKPGSGPPSPCGVESGPKARIGEEGLLGGAGNPERRNERKPPRCARSPGPRLEPILEPEPAGTMQVAHVKRSDAHAERAGMLGLRVPGSNRARSNREGENDQNRRSCSHHGPLTGWNECCEPCSLARTSIP